ncbi:achaete-scute homolog 2-like [Mizuhopecten yessoensis]|uniref:Helix-loop-helix protein 4 n=1 Tax=Mizuhopecten yessoensis TaxID=6573 RepID=A0A210PQY3_MIZYE|nr:achaete-scute homolog 2-like [Mizuhopecten yessoensis]OWF38909.1 Helix-loop-helix protein 4 [Mizuhopecten yessoensis]
MVNTLQSVFDSSLFGTCQYSCPKITCKTRKRRHVPHSQRSPEYVLHRNTRERRRVEAINDAFQLLKKHVPLIDETDDKASKVGILYGAARYIRVLADILENTSRSTTSRSDVNGNTLMERQDMPGCDTNSLNNCVIREQKKFHYCQPQFQNSSSSPTCMFMEIQNCPSIDYTQCLENVPPRQHISAGLPDPRDCQAIYTSTNLLWQ